MPLAARHAAGEPEICSATILSAPNEIQNSFEMNLFSSDAFSPELFVASVDERHWRPRVTLVTQNKKPVGILYGKERKLAGVATGLVYADMTLGGFSVCCPSLRNEVLSCAAVRLSRSPGLRGLRFAVPFHGMDLSTLRDVSERTAMDLAFRYCHNHSVLPLPFTYDAFLEKLGSKTRRNFRYYRRHFEREGGEYVAQLGREEVEKACSDLRTCSRIPAKDRAVLRALRITAVTERPFAVGLRRNGGEWMSVLAGWFERDRAVVFLQINRDADYPKLSLSLVMRAYFVEALIASGIREIVFWAGTSGALSRYATEIPTAFVYLDKSSLAWRTSRRVISRMQERAPIEFKPLLSWIAAPPEPFSDPEQGCPSQISTPLSSQNVL